jgi:hypothetical protein
MTTDITTRPPAQALLADRTLIRSGAAFALTAGALRLPSSFIDPDTSGIAIETLYYAIDVSLLFAAITAFAAIPSSRTRPGTVGFAVAAVGTGLLIGPEPTDANIEYYAVGATAVTIGFAFLAIAWRHSPTVTPTTRRAFLATVAAGAASGLHDAVFITAGIAFSVALLSLGRDLHRIGTPPERTAPRR